MMIAAAITTGGLVNAGIVLAAGVAIMCGAYAIEPPRRPTPRAPGRAARSVGGRAARPGRAVQR